MTGPNLKRVDLIQDTGSAKKKNLTAPRQVKEIGKCQNLACERRNLWYVRGEIVSRAPGTAVKSQAKRLG